jgi:hypothetical protein
MCSHIYFFDAFDDEMLLIEMNGRPLAAAPLALGVSAATASSSSYLTRYNTAMFIK